MAPTAITTTSATYHSGRGLKTIQLQSLMGWEDLRTPMRYVQNSGERTARALQRIHNG